VVDLCGYITVRYASVWMGGGGGTVRRRPEEMRMWYVGVEWEVCLRRKAITEPKVYLPSAWVHLKVSPPGTRTSRHPRLPFVSCSLLDECEGGRLQ